MKLHFAIQNPIVLLLVTSLAPFVAGRIGRSNNIRLSTPSEKGLEEACATDVKKCYDGSYVSRIPKNNCQFEECPPLLCDDDVKQCPDGFPLSRDPSNFCEFPDCPPVECQQDVKECIDGSFVSRDPGNECQFEECPSILMCGTDVKECDDGSFVSRDPKNDCQFEKCTSDIICTTDVKECNDGSFVSRDPWNECQFEECPSSLVCDTDVKECDDGSFVSRDSKNDCQFGKCPSLVPITVQYPICTAVEGLENNCLSCCLDSFKSYRDDKCGNSQICHDVNVPSFLKCENQCVLTCQGQCINQDRTCVKACEENFEGDDQNACLATCNDNWWFCSGACQQERLDNRENLNNMGLTSSAELEMTKNLRLPSTYP